MGCSFSRLRRDQEAEKLKDDKFTNISETHGGEMPPKGNRKRRAQAIEQAPPTTSIQDDDRKFKDYQKKFNTQEDERNSLFEKLKQSRESEFKKEKEIEKMNDTLAKLKQENNTLQIRLSSLVSANLTNNNPNIADLSDVNRPTKLADQYNELYDNEWTDAITSLESQGFSEKQGLDILRDMLMNIYGLCENKAEKQMTVLNDAMGGFMKNTNIPTQMIKHLKETRKENYRDFLPDLNQAMQTQLDVYGDTNITGVTQKYQEKCLELCWLICIQDPPVFMDCDVAVNGRLFDKRLYKEYTTTGRFMDYLVWPALHLLKGGALLCKGTVQAMVEKG